MTNLYLQYLANLLGTCFCSLTWGLCRLGGPAGTAVCTELDPIGPTFNHMALVHISALGSWAQWGICFQAAAQSKALQANTTNLCWKPQCSTGLRAHEGRGAGACRSEEPLAQSDLYLFDVRKYIVCRLETINMTIRRKEWILCVGGFHQLWPLIWPRDWCL